MGFSGKVFSKGGKKLGKVLSNYADEIENAQVQVINELVINVHRAAVESIQDNADGTLTKRYYKNQDPKFVFVSNPGEAPNTDSGRLAKSIKMNFAKKKKLVGEVGTNLEYGAWLELGTENMSPRPWLLPAFMLATEGAADLFAERTREAIRKASTKE